MQAGICALCLEPKDLCRSHIIPNAVFRRIKSDNQSGQLIELNDADGSPVQYSQGSWWEYLLCLACERTIRAYEAYGLSFLRGGSGANVHQHGGGLTFRGHCYDRFKLFLTSLLWRAAVSRQAHFSKVILLSRDQEAARRSLLLGAPLPPLRLGCRLARLVDHTAVGDGGFSEQTLKHLIIAPIPRLFHHSKYFTFLFLLEGFLIEFFAPTIPHKLSGNRGMHRDSAILFVPRQSIFDIPEIVGLMVSAYGKFERGLVTFQD